MRKTKPEDTLGSNRQSSPLHDETTGGIVVASSNVTDQQCVSPALGDLQSDPVTNPPDEIKNTSAPNKSKKVCRNPNKPSSNFTTLERTFILMAIAAVRTDPYWRKHDDPADPETLKDFSEPFCNAVRQKLMEDPDFMGRVTVVTAGSDQERKYRQSPCKESIRAIWKNLYINGSLTRPRGRGRSKDLAAEERVKEYLAKNPDCHMSSRAIAAQTQTSHRNVIRIIRQENLVIRKTKFKRIDEPAKRKARRTTKMSSEKNNRSPKCQRL